MRKLACLVLVLIFASFIILYFQRQDNSAAVSIEEIEHAPFSPPSQRMRATNSVKNVSGASLTGQQGNVGAGVYKPKSLQKGQGSETVVEIEHGLSRQLVNTPEMRRGVDRGLLGAITLRVVDSNGRPVQGAEIYGGFWNYDRNNPPATGLTDKKGEIHFERNCAGDFNFSITKDGFYKTRLRYWFFKNGYDCAKDGRWLPWNPTVEIVLKEKRNPIPLYTKTVRKVFPKEVEVGFDCLCADFVAPWGQGRDSDFTLKYESVRPPVRTGMKYPDFSCFTNYLALSGVEAGGFITKPKDSFSHLVADYEAPENGYARVLDYELKRTTGKIFVDRKLGDEEYLFFRSRVRQTTGGSEEAHYGKIYQFVFSETLRETNSATLRISYYFNPTPNDRNLEFDGTNNLFKPDWRETSWPREP